MRCRGFGNFQIIKIFFKNASAKRYFCFTRFPLRDNTRRVTAYWFVYSFLCWRVLYFYDTQLVSRWMTTDYAHYETMNTANYLYQGARLLQYETVLWVYIKSLDSKSKFLLSFHKNSISLMHQKYEKEHVLVNKKSLKQNAPTALATPYVHASKLHSFKRMCVIFLTSNCDALFD